MILITRKPAHKLSLKKRHTALKSIEAIQIRKLKKMLLLVGIHRYCNPEGIKHDDLSKFLLIKYFSLRLTPVIARTPSTPSTHRTVSSFQEWECHLFFRLRRPELLRVIRLLQFPNKVYLSNDTPLPGEEVFLRGMYELVSGADQLRIAEHVFGLDQSTQSRAFTCFINHVYNNFNHLLKDNLSWWIRNGFLHQSAKAFRKKMYSNCKARGISEEHATFISELQPIAMHIDCNCLPTSVVGGGPAESGANAARWADDIQRAFYNGWKSIHGLKHQTVDNAFGMTVDMYGPCSIRRNDLQAFRESNLHDRMHEIEQLRISRLTIMGDSAYFRKLYLSTYYRGERAQLEHFKQWNKAMKSVRISIEWNYGYTATLFSYVTNKKN